MMYTIAIIFGMKVSLHSVSHVDSNRFDKSLKTLSKIRHTNQLNRHIQPTTLSQTLSQDEYNLIIDTIQVDQIVFFMQNTKTFLVKLGVETCTSNLKVEKCVGGRCHSGLNEFRSESFEYNGLSTKKR